MPTLTRWFIKSSLIYFVAALLLALASSSLPVAQATLSVASNREATAVFLRSLGPVYFHLFLVGWVTQLIFGVVYWMFPKCSIEKPRGSESLAWAVFWLLNAGLILRAVAEPLNTLRPESAWGWLLALSALLQWLAGSAFVANTWPRVKER